MSAGPPAAVRRPFLSTGTLVLLGLMAVGFSFGLARFLAGLGAVTNLSDAYPWGIWIAIDVACGVALAAGGFTTAALIEIFGQRRFRPLLRPAILTAWLGYSMVAFALVFDLGRYWNVWRPVFNWQGNSALFEVGMCVVAYLVVLTVEMAPALLEGIRQRATERRSLWMRRLERPARLAHAAVTALLPLFVIAGVVLSSMHQSSLGTLMVIAPTKLHPLFYSPRLPLLFLLSAMMVGFPMVVIESIIAGTSFGRRIEMDLLGGLARAMPWFIGAYLAAKVVDLALRVGPPDFWSQPTATVALSVEILAGLVAPLCMLLVRRVRESSRWLFTACALVIGGVVLNRIDVFLIGYTPPFSTRAYFPSAGEIAVTGAIVATIMFLYRVFASFFPVLAEEPGLRPAAPAPRVRPEPVSPTWEWVFRGVGVVGLLGFVLLYALVHQRSIDQSLTTYQRTYRPRAMRVEARTVTAVPHRARPEGYQTMYLLDNKRLRGSSDDYEPVRFSHRSHDNWTGGDCSQCHHRHAAEPGDRIGKDLRALHEEMDVRLGPACGSCHGDLDANRPQACERCHRDADEPDAPARLGLLGAYHRQCIGCHADLPSTAQAPVDCAGCHHARTPDHKTLVKLDARATPTDVTARCLSCHPSAGADVLKSAHWLWRGHSPQIEGHEHAVGLGMSSVLNNYLIGAGANLEYCAACHVGYGRTTPDFDLSDARRIDCLVCHDTTGSYRRDPGGMPDPSVDLVAVAQQVGRPSREACGHCHFRSDGAANTKHGDLEPVLGRPPPELDVHMGRADMRCQDCHMAAQHRIAGASYSAPVTEGRVGCVRCHGDRPHGIAGVTGRHLDGHLISVACETCHIPMVARATPTQVRVDYSTAGRDGAPTSALFPLRLDGIGLLSNDGPPPLDGTARPIAFTGYDKRFGDLELVQNLVPTYAWDDGKHAAHPLGKTIDPDAPVPLNAPLGQRDDPRARIRPFKVHTAMQPYDTERKVLVTPKLWNGYWTHFDWGRAIRDGMAAVGQPTSGKYGFVETRMVHALEHEVAPARLALSCADCHQADAVACTRCHPKAVAADVAANLRRRYPGLVFLDFKALGYPDDPARIGGRFFVTLGRGTPPQ
jgi:octaheme c-type cytochrome (tetrathionate reductase family)